MRIIRNGVAGALIASVPVTTSIAATRPNAAVPVAGSTAVVAQGEYGGGSAIAWPAIAVIVAALLVGIWIAVDDDDDGEGSLSRA